MDNIMHYAPVDVQVFVGPFQLQGFSKDSLVSIEKSVVPFSSSRAMDGERIRVYTKDDGFKVRVTLAQSSPANDVLSSIYNVDLALQVGKFPLFIKDSSGTTQFFAATAWIRALPMVDLNNSLTERVWEFECYQAILNVGGNVSPSMLEEILSAATTGLPLLKDLGLF